MFSPVPPKMKDTVLTEIQYTSHLIWGKCLVIVKNQISGNITNSHKEVES